MAKFISLKRLLAVMLIAVASAALAATEDNASRMIHFQLWAMLEATPGADDAAKKTGNVFDYPVSKLKETAPFLVQGMIYGFRFNYTPSDTLRNVPETFSFEPVRALGEDEKRINYSTPRIENNRLYCWVDFEKTVGMIFQKKQWETVSTLKISGRGQGKLTDGFSGITEASRDALKNAVREYGRSIEKNKPKEITGTALITGTPRLEMQSGKYEIALDFFLQISIIVPYSQY
jgi:hypothetical protein